jgi:hypothetical protein
VYDLVANIDRSAVQAQGALDDLDGAVDSGAKAAWFGENDLHGQFELVVDCTPHDHARSVPASN